MDLLSRLSEWLESFRRPQDDPAREDPVDRDGPVKLTLRGRRFKLQLEIPRSERADNAEHVSAAAEEICVPGAEVRTGRSVPPQTSAGMRASHVGLYNLPQQEQTTSRESRRQSPAASFWDALDPTEREALRSVASWRTFAAGARLMEEGERADHVMVILGGQVKICVDENGSERVLAVRGLGQLVGERGALKVSMRSATVIALEMIWALVVQTKDFAAFISAHPRILDIVQDQLYQRHTEGPAGRVHDTDGPGSSRAEAARSTAADVRLDTNYMAGHSRRRSQTLNGENCTVFLTDVVRFGARTRTDNDRLLIREVLFRMTQAAIQGMPDAQSEDRGDGFLTVVPPDTSTGRVIDQIFKEFPVALELHNSTQRESARFKLRLAVNVGPVVSDMGVSGEAIILAARLVEAPYFKEAIAGSAASLGVIASPFVYETVIRHRADPRDVASYSQVPVEVKESDTTAWMKLFDVSVPLTPYSASPESYLGPLTRARSQPGCPGASTRCIRVSVSLRLGADVASRASGRDSQRSGAFALSGRIASGVAVAMKNRTSACWWAGSPLPGGTLTMTTCLISASGHGARSARPVSSSASLATMASGSVSPGSPWPPTCSQACWRWCQRSSTRAVGGCTISADAVTCSGRSRWYGLPAVAKRARTRWMSAVSVSPCGR
jgi:CRP-like cAMP-binding protein